MKMNREQIKGAVAYHKQMSAHLLTIMEQVNDNVADKGMLGKTICEFHKFIFQELKEFMGNQWEQHLKKERQ